MKVRIVKAEKGSYWYSSLIGNVFTVSDESCNLRDYRVITGIHANDCIALSDCEVVGEEWIPKQGERVLVRDYDGQEWEERTFVVFHDKKYHCESFTSNTLAYWKQIKQIKKKREIKLTMKELEDMVKIEMNDDNITLTIIKE